MDACHVSITRSRSRFPAAMHVVTNSDERACETLILNPEP